MDNNLLNDRLGKLKDWEQTESLNEILFNTLSSLNAYTKERFDELTQEIRSESALHCDVPVIKTAVCTGENINNQLFLYPVSKNPPVNNPHYITTVFAECDYRMIQEMMRREFTATINCKTETVQTQVSLRYSSKYLQKMESLYYIFCENELPWATIDGSYFYKFLDVSLSQDKSSEIVDFTINFEHFEKYISFDKELLWNVVPVTVPVASSIARPAYNTVQFEHTLKNIQFDENRYLVCHLGEKFTSFRRGQEMFVRTGTQHEQIELLRIVGGECKDNPLHLQVKTNQKKDGYINSIVSRRYVPTRGEAERIVNSLCKNIHLEDLKVLPRTDENILRCKSVDYNYFVESNSFLQDKKLLLFTFDVKTDSIWAYETMCFVLSELQLYFYEYHCVGELA